MKTLGTLTLLALSGTVLSGCVPVPVSFESEPVVLQTAEGPVTCQLYIHDMVVWDRATDRPDSMTVETADNLCKQEGNRLLGVVSEPAAAPAAAP